VRPRIGVLALQGDFEAHRKALEQACADAVEVRSSSELESIDGLIIPGGESTTILKLLELEGLAEPIRALGAGKPIFGTCAGAILLSNEVVNPRQPSLALIDMTIQRNAYGRQIDSRIAQIELNGHPAEAVFIRAPVITRVGPAVEVLAAYNGDPVLVRQGRHLAATFHPELSTNAEIHKQFVANVIASRKQARVG
jgi:5'-phosphate synthase pdxT subunit